MQLEFSEWYLVWPSPDHPQIEKKISKSSKTIVLLRNLGTSTAPTHYFLQHWNSISLWAFGLWSFAWLLRQVLCLSQCNGIKTRFVSSHNWSCLLRLWLTYIKIRQKYSGANVEWPWLSFPSRHNGYPEGGQLRTYLGFSNTQDIKMSDNILKAPAIQQENDWHLVSFIRDVKQPFPMTTSITFHHTHSVCALEWHILPQKGCNVVKTIRNNLVRTWETGVSSTQ